MTAHEPELHFFRAATPLPLIVHRGALAPGEGAAERCQRLFAEHDWTGAWVDGIYPYDHFHATTHEVLGIVRGEARVRFGGDAGESVTVAAGDVVVIPAGVSHRREQGSGDLSVVGAYPQGRAPDIEKGTPAAPVRRDLAVVPVPAAHPVFGREGPLPRLWSKGAR